jgi:hypothetical protein
MVSQSVENNRLLWVQQRGVFFLSFFSFFSIGESKSDESMLLIIMLLTLSGVSDGGDALFGGSISSRCVCSCVCCVGVGRVSYIVCT